MRLNEYMSLALRTAKHQDDRDMLIHAALGLSGEAGEFSDAVKRCVVYDNALRHENAVEELGDLLWYVALAAHALNITLDDVADYNIAKLKLRYPQQYSDALANGRADKVPS